mmetsp:Transcript_63871/g.103249  ORF Transcript_63871/g.103249 Transcript_63871/m.103249 type:complete len:653 (+) Transcript_63871:2-1960(+)
MESKVREIDPLSKGAKDKRDEILEQRKQLPIFKARKEILAEFSKHDTLVLVGETGSGKTTQIPQFLYSAGFAKHGLIAITQPRRVAATTVAARVAQEMACRLGTQVGYTVRFDDCSGPDTRVKFMTDGMLMRELMLDPKLKRYSVILLDEAHERTLNTELLLALVKRLQKTRANGNRPLKVMVMSATLEAEAYASFFHNPTIIRVPGRRFPVQVLYTAEPTPDFLDAAVTTAVQIHLEEEKGDILCFLTGQDQIDDAVKVIKERSRALPPSADKLLPCALYAALPPAEQLAAFAPAPHGTRKVVFATNIAESSITIEGIKFVIDTGLVKTRVFEPKSNIESLHNVPISKAQCLQRTGRAGRVCAGKSYRLFTEDQFEELSQSAVPEIKRVRLASTVLQLKVMGIENLLEFEFMEAPPRKLLLQALQELLLLGAIDKNKQVTELGKKMATLPLEPPQAKLLLESEKFECSQEALTVVAMMSVDSFFFTPAGKKEEAAQARAIFEHGDGDHFTYLKVYEGWVKSHKSKAWCDQHFVNGRNMKKVADIRDQLQGYCEQAKVPMISCGAELTNLARCLCTAFYANAASVAPDGKGYKVESSALQVQLHPSSVLFQRRPKAVIYNELVFTTKLYMRHCCIIDTAWLPELVPDLYRTA